MLVVVLVLLVIFAKITNKPIEWIYVFIVSAVTATLIAVVLLPSLRLAQEELNESRRIQKYQEEKLRQAIETQIQENSHALAQTKQ